MLIYWLISIDIIVRCEAINDWIFWRWTYRIKSEIIAFLNSDGGIIYVGVDDDGSIIGINNQAKDNIDLKLGS